MVGLVETPDEVMFYEDMVGFSSDGGGFGKFDDGLVVFVADGVTRTAVQLYEYRRTFGSDRGRSEPSDS